jgi:hemerythrin-like domain-containing protein
LQRQVDFYTGVHKGQRAKFSTISNAAGTLNINDQNAITALEGELNRFREHMYFHAHLEEKFIHPLLSQRVPGGADKLNKDHRIMHQQFDALVACFGEIKSKPADFEKSEELSLEFYRAWARFTSFYLNHIDYEEEYVMPSLWKLCTNGELAETFKKILADQTPQEIMDNLAIILPAMNPIERVMILNAGRATLPPEALQAALKIAERVLTHADLASLKKALQL